MSQTLEPQILAALVLLAAMAHVALLLSARWLNIVFVACAAFVVVSPLSVAAELPGLALLKWGRVYLVLVMIVLYLLAYRTIRLGVASWAFLMFLGFYTLAGLWSDHPVGAVTFKGMYATVVLAGLLLASSVRSFHDLRIGLRVLAVAAAVYGVVVFAGLAQNPGSLVSGRLTIWGWNANRIGHDCAAMVAICLFVGLYDRTKIWKLYSFGLAAYFGFIILATGSRAALGMAMISGVVLAAPLFRRPVLLTTLAVVGGLLANTFLQYVTSKATDRIGEINFSNRQGVWSIGLEYFAQSPMIGAGWVYEATGTSAGSTANLHSIYVQILAETGMVGAFIFLVCMLICSFKALVVLRSLLRCPEAAPFAFFAFALGGATLAHGMAESGTIQGTNLNGLLLPFAIGLLDRIPQLIREEVGAEATWDAEPLSDSGEYAASYGDEPQPA